MLSDGSEVDGEGVLSSLPPRPKLIRQASEHAATQAHECFCSDLVKSMPGHIRMPCQCLLHYACLVTYVRVKLGDRSSITPRGVPCPFGAMCVSRSAEATSEQASLFFITPDQLAVCAPTLSGKHSSLCAFSEPLTRSEIDKLRRFMMTEEEEEAAAVAAGIVGGGGGTAGSSSIKKISGDEMTRKYIDATTKPCPKCKYQASHFHGHMCHHVNEGCRNCKMHFCYRCLCTAEQNEEERGSRGACKCGGWSNFCDGNNVLDNLVFDSGYPTDKRCGCAICPECKPRNPCSTCNGRCVVCLGDISPGPLELTDAWVALPEGRDSPEARAARAVGRAANEQYQQQVAYNYELSNFLTACRSGNADEASGMLAQHEEARRTQMLNSAGGGIDGHVPIFLAMFGKSPAMLRWLLEQPGIIVDNRDRNGSTPFSWCASHSQLTFARLLLQHGAGIDAQDFNGWTPLYCACLNGHAELVRFLLENGARCHMTVSMSGWMPLHGAAYGGNLDCTRHVIAAGAEIDALDRHNRTPLAVAVIAAENPRIVEALLDQGADPRIRDDDGNSPLIIAKRDRAVRNEESRMFIMEEIYNIFKKRGFYDGAAPSVAAAVSSAAVSSAGGGSSGGSSGGGGGVGTSALVADAPPTGPVPATGDHWLLPSAQDTVRPPEIPRVDSPPRAQPPPPDTLRPPEIPRVAPPPRAQPPCVIA